MRDSHYSPFLLPETPEFSELLWAPTPPPDPQLAKAMNFACRHDIIINPAFKSIGRISFFKRLGVYLNAGLLGSASIRRRRLFQKSKQKKMKSCVTSEQKDIS